jgi:TolB-like protein
LGNAQVTVIYFEDFSMDIGAAELRQDATLLQLEPQVFDLIHFLALNAGRVVSRDEIIDAVWGGRIVSDASISTRINAARKVLGDDGKSQRLIKTVQKRGFRFVPEAVIGEPDTGIRSAEISSSKLVDRDAGVPDRPSIVILPFENLSDDPQQAYLADGLRIDIQNALVKVSGVFLIAAGSANAVRDLAPQDAAEKLGIQYALEGSVRRAGDQLRISVQLTDYRLGQILWSDQFDRDVEETFQVLDQITAKVLTAVNAKLVMGEQAKVWNRVLGDLKSLETFYQGINEFFKMNGEALRLARYRFEKIHELHPELSIGPTWIALTHWYDFQRGWTDDADQSRKLAQSWAESAVTMEDADGQAHTVLSHVYLLDRRFEDALEMGQNAVKNRPNCAHANGFYANVLHYCGQQEQALNHIKSAIRYAPFHPPLFKNILAAAYRAVGQLDEAILSAEGAAASSVGDLISRVLLASLYMKQENPGKANDQMVAINSIDPAFSLAAFASRQPYKDEVFLNAWISELRSVGFSD